MSQLSVVVIGSGQGGFQVAHSLRQDGFAGRITLVGDEPYLPYQRPPLSKAYLLGKQDADGLLLRQPDFYAQEKIELSFPERVIAVDRVAKKVELASGKYIAYDNLVLATGARVRELPVEGASLENMRLENTRLENKRLDGVFYMRTLDDAKAIERRLPQAKNIVVIGGGFIGLEFAAVARQLGKQVTVVEALPRLMARVVAPVMSNYFAGVHQAHGVDLRLGVGVTRLLDVNGKIESIELADGSLLPADLIVVGIGVIANDELASEAGLECQNGVLVDGYLRTGDPSIYAIGDCVQHENIFAGARIRVESVQNAVDQARSVASSILGNNAPYRSVPWFWSDQYDLKLQMVGISTGFDQTVLRGETASNRFSVFYYRQAKLIGIDSVNRAADHMLGRRLIGQGLSVPPEVAADEAADLKSYLA